ASLGSAILGAGAEVDDSRLDPPVDGPGAWHEISPNITPNIATATPVGHTQDPTRDPRAGRRSLIMASFLETSRALRRATPQRFTPAGHHDLHHRDPAYTSSTLRAPRLTLQRSLASELSPARHRP